MFYEKRFVEKYEVCPRRYVEINEITGFANGDQWENEEELREYFTVENMQSMFPGDWPKEYGQFFLDEMLDDILDNHWHCNF